MTQSRDYRQDDSGHNDHAFSGAAAPEGTDNTGHTGSTDRPTDRSDNSSCAEPTASHLPPGAREVMHDLRQPFEAPAPQLVPGPYYAAVEEVLTELAPTEAQVVGDDANPSEDCSPGEASLEHPWNVDRREFLKLFSLTALAGVSSCVPRPVEKIVPYTEQPLDTVPGVTKSYSTTCGECAVGCGVEVKTKDGRPFKLEGRADHPVNMGALCAVGQASIQGLYHPERAKEPKIRSSGRWLTASWEQALETIAKEIKSKEQAPRVGVFTGALSESSRKFYELFLQKIGSSAQHLYSWEPKSLPHAMAKAHELAWQQSGIPRLRLDRAEVVVGVCTDFLTTGISPLYHSRGFMQGLGYRRGGAKNQESQQRHGQGFKGRFVQFESNLTITGAKADQRYTIASGTELALLLKLLEALVELQASALGNHADLRQAKQIITAQQAAMASYERHISRDHLKALRTLAGELVARPGCVVAGGVDVAVEYATQIQLVALMCNKLIGAYDGGILVFHEGWHPYRSEDQLIQRFLREAPGLDMLFVIEADPMRSLSPSWGVQHVLAEVKTVVSIQTMPAVVDTLAHYQLPSHHYLESWGDEEPFAGMLSLRQPAVRPLYNTRQAQDSLMWIAAYAGHPLGYAQYREYMLAYWQQRYQGLFPQLSGKVFEQSILRKGWIGQLARRSLRDKLADVRMHIKLPQHVAVRPAHLRLTAPYDYRLGDGRFAHLPILQEIGDSLSTVAWDSFAAVNPYTCRELGIKRNDVIRLTLPQQPEATIEVAVYPMPGVDRHSVVIHQGGGVDDERNTIAHGLGVNPLKVVGAAADGLTGEPVNTAEVRVDLTKKVYRLAAMQKHNDIANRKDVFRRVGLSWLDKKIHKRLASGQTKNLDDVPDLYPALDRPEIYMHKQENKARAASYDAAQVQPPRSIDYRWSMSVDLGKCTGCGACMVACSLENNVPQVGRDEINLGREMFWIRLDRYFDGSVDEPGVSFQPVMCQHCNHAPCEAVCPVFATTHDPEGINAMTYNRCVGTRYCANACPYKVRRFNWWTHQFGAQPASAKSRDRTPRALNPDVTTRTRGVMEKCNFCYGRLVEAKHANQQKSSELGMKSVPVSSVSTACEQTCPVSAITFGNLKEPSARVASLRRDERAYLMLGGDHDHGHYGIKTLPNVFYLAEVVHDELAPAAEH